MTTITVDNTLSEWDQAVATNDHDRWKEHLTRVPVCDFFPVLAEREALRQDSTMLTISQWLNHMGSRKVPEITAEIASTAVSSDVRLASVTYLHWLDKIETLVRDSRLPHLPSSGVIQYFSDHLAASVLLEYERIGSAVMLGQSLAVPNPASYLDPLRVLRHAHTRAQLDLLRRSLYSRHKIVVQRNVLIHIDRERASDVFGPAIDTFVLNDWLHANRYAQQRTDTNLIYFENPVGQSATTTSLAEGTTFLEVGCGNGLLTASFAKNEAKIRSFEAIDVSHSAVSATYENVATQRQLHGLSMARRGWFTIGNYNVEAVRGSANLVVCNPPYLPRKPDSQSDAHSHPLLTATVGTELMQQVVGDVTSLLAPNGELLMVSSTLSEPELISSVPPGFLWQRLITRTVPFDIEAIRGDGEHQYIAWLKAERGLQARKNELSHNIAIYRVYRADGG